VPESVPIVVQRAEWEAGRERAAIERNFLQPRDYDIEPRRLRLRSIATAKELERTLGATVGLHHDLRAQRAVHSAPRHYD
jgi:hypothetical protein